MSRASRGALALALLIGADAARAQVPDCDSGAGLVDLIINVRFEDYTGCPPGSGLPCVQDPQEEDLVGWQVTLAPGPGTAGDSGVTDASGDSAWTGNGGLVNTCVGAGSHTVTLALPDPNPYDPEAHWPGNLTFPFTIAPADQRFTFTLQLTCVCESDDDLCTRDACQNGLCPYTAVAFDPARAEVCNGGDDDCDGATDEGLPPDAPECGDASAIGCADGTREGFMDWDAYPLIAACGGAWFDGGIDSAVSCARAAGNHGDEAAGADCAAADLCPDGWHICYGPDDVAQRTGGDCADAVDPLYPNFGSGPTAADISVPPGGAFFASAARADGTSCSEGVNDGAADGDAGVFGCGNMGMSLSPDACGFFDRAAGAICGGLRDVDGGSDAPATDYGYADEAEWAWTCGPTVGDERAALRKVVPDRQGGVLCCKDADPTLPEVCDAIDNDLDGDTDEFGFDGGPVVEVGGACETGGQCGDLVCTPDGGWDCVGLHGCADTSCDGVDDDADGSTDDEYVPVATTCGEGVCAASGASACVDGDEVDGCEPGAPDAATDVDCDGLDGDCDGETDEEFAAGPTACGQGACAATGESLCAEGVPTNTCEPGSPLAEDDATCDAIDDDCDGASDEDAGSTLTGCGVGACATTGTETCVDGALVDSCEPLPKAASDATCDSVDDDCDGTSDEDFDAEATTCGVGVCAGNTGARGCTEGVEADSCDPLDGARVETCDGADDDCDGDTDEGFGVGDACDGDDEDACDNGVLACASGRAVCEESGEGAVEVCDGEDNDCDDDVDEGVEGCGDKDRDDVPDFLDNCDFIKNANQDDSDGDGDGDACDAVGQGGACAGGGADAALLGLALVALALARRRA